MADVSLYTRLGGYDAIAAVVDHLLPRLMADVELGRFWAHRGDDGLAREKQFLVDFLCASAGGPMYYTGRNMKTTHQGMGITNSDWEVFMGHLTVTLAHLEVPDPETTQVLAFINSTKADMVVP